MCGNGVGTGMIIILGHLQIIEAQLVAPVYIPAA
jgi:hypothetical protein